MATNVIGIVIIGKASAFIFIKNAESNLNASLIGTAAAVKPTLMPMFIMMQPANTVRTSQRYQVDSYSIVSLLSD